MLTWTCNFEGCERASLPVAGNCFVCHKHLCGEHYALPHHACLGMTHDEQTEISAAATRVELEALTTHINSFDLADEAQKARPGGSVKVNPIGTIDPSELSRGGMNVHVPIEFEDGVQWYARFRQRRFDCPPPEVAWEAMVSEFWTMQALERAGVKVPKAYLGLRSRSGLFFFIEHIQGNPCAAPMYTDLPVHELDKLINTYAETSAKIASTPFKGIGSITWSADQPGSGQVVGPLISLDFCTPSPPYFLGPFRTNLERYLAFIDHAVSQSKPGKERGDRDAEALYYTHSWLRNLISSMAELDKDEPTYIKHADDKGDQVMVDKEMIVTGLIDWEWAYTAPKAEAFAGPLGVVDVDAFFSGDNHLSEHENMLAEAYDAIGHKDLGDCVRGGKLYQRLAMVIGQPPDLVQLHALQELVTGVKGPETTIEEWVQKLKGKYGPQVV